MWICGSSTRRVRSTVRRSWRQRNAEFIEEGHTGEEQPCSWFWLSLQSRRSVAWFWYLSGQYTSDWRSTASDWKFSSLPPSVYLAFSFSLSLSLSLSVSLVCCLFLALSLSIFLLLYYVDLYVYIYIYICIHTLESSGALCLPENYRLCRNVTL